MGSLGKEGTEGRGREGKDPKGNMLKSIECNITRDTRKDAGHSHANLPSHANAQSVKFARERYIRLCAKLGRSFPLPPFFYFSPAHRLPCPASRYRRPPDAYWSPQSSALRPTAASMARYVPGLEIVLHVFILLSVRSY